MTNGLTWRRDDKPDGVNAGLLNSEFGAAAAKGWACLNRPSPTGSVDAETGRLGYCQPGGASPQGNFNSSTTSDFCVGTFLLAGSEMAKLSQASSAQGGTPSGIEAFSRAKTAKC